MRSHQAFTLIELMLALTLFSISSVAMFGFLATTVTWASSSIRVMRDATATALALDCVERDVMSACNNLKDWDVARNIFKIETIDVHGKLLPVWVGWDVVKQGLRRRQGVYDKVHARWTHATSSIVGCTIKSLALEPILHSHTKRIETVHIACAASRRVRLWTRSF